MSDESSQQCTIGSRGVAIVVLALLCVSILAGGWAYRYFHSKKMNRAYRYNAYSSLKLAHEHFRNFGIITNPGPASTQIFPFTNEFVIGKANYKCVLGMLWGGPDMNKSLLGVTEAGVVIWLEDTNAPKVMEFNGKR